MTMLTKGLKAFLNASLLGRWVINSHDQGQFDFCVKIAWKKCTNCRAFLFKRHLTFCLQKVPKLQLDVIIYPCVVLQVFYGITCHWCNHFIEDAFPKEAAARAADEERAATEAAKAFAAEMTLGEDVEKIGFALMFFCCHYFFCMGGQKMWTF